MRWTAGILLVCIAMVPSGPRADESTRALMAKIVAPLTRLLPVSLDEKAYADPARQAEIAAALAELEAATARVEGHGKGRDIGFRYLGRSLHEEAERAAQRFERGRYAPSRYALLQLTDTCISCHSRLPSKLESPIADRLFADADVSALPVRQRARLEMATRRFDAALDSYEAAFADPAIRPSVFDMSGDLLDYLTICLRVRLEVVRPQRTLEKLLARPDVPNYLRHNLESWRTALAQLEGELKGPATMARAKEWIERSHEARGYAGSRSGLVYDLAASSDLHRLLAAAAGTPEARDETAQTLYLIGITDTWTQRSYHESEAEFALRTAIRLAPDQWVARQAYRLLEEYTVLGYSGSGGIHIPQDVQAELDELWALIEAAQTE